MNHILNITNGDSTVDLMQQANIPGVYLPWRDVLHDGPVPEGLSLEALSEVRSNFISSQGWGEPELIRLGFIERDDTLKSFKQYEKIILWFEHDLYDQLQILQILDWFNNHRCDKTQLSIICVDQYLGMLSADEISTLYKFEVTVTDNHLTLSSAAWSAFRSPSSENWYDLLNTDTKALPFLNGAIVRMLEEYPASFNGLSRIANQALKSISLGINTPWDIFTHYQQSEQRKFLGDSSFWIIIQTLIDSTPPLLKLSEGNKLSLPINPDQKITITKTGEDVLLGQINWLDFSTLDRWIGGVHLTQNNTWCWDSDSRVLVKIIEAS